MRDFFYLETLLSIPGRSIYHYLYLVNTCVFVWEWVWTIVKIVVSDLFCLLWLNMVYRSWWMYKIIPYCFTLSWMTWEKGGWPKMTKWEIGEGGQKMLFCKCNTFWMAPDILHVDADDSPLNKTANQPAVTCSNLTVETVKQDVKYVQS